MPVCKRLRLYYTIVCKSLKSPNPQKYGLKSDFWVQVPDSSYASLQVVLMKWPTSFVVSVKIPLIVYYNEN